MNHTQPLAKEAGFSLMETLVALAILSISAVLIFQSLISQSQLTARVETISLEVGQESIARAGFSNVVAGLVPSWPEDTNTPFVATSALLTGLTNDPLIRRSSGLTPFQFELTGVTSELVYSAEGEILSLAAFNDSASFSYLGADGIWYPVWPPTETHPDFGNFDDSAAYPIPPLPLAVRIQTQSRAELDWIARLDWNAPYLPRRQDIDDD